VNTPETLEVALFGASVRAVAQSAKAAGFGVFGCDLFNDEDLMDCCDQVVRINRRHYPKGFRRIAEQWPGVPRVSTGGLENHPDVIAHLAATGPLWGCSPATLLACREPGALDGCGFATPNISLTAADVPTDGSWLYKPKHGSAGRGIHPWFGGKLTKNGFLQRRIEGSPCSAAFLALTDAALLIGAATQFIGETWTGAPPFAYAGGIAPLELSSQTAQSLQRLGETLRSRFALRGLFGVDAVRNGDDWTILEINPRPTASMELFELAGAGSMFELHRSAFENGAPLLKAPSRFAGKAIYYATERCRLIESLPARDDLWTFADRPAVKSVFDADDPIVTVLAHGETTEEVLKRLKRGIAQLGNLLTKT